MSRQKNINIHIVKMQYRLTWTCIQTSYHESPVVFSLEPFVTLFVPVLDPAVVAPALLVVTAALVVVTAALVVVTAALVVVTGVVVVAYKKR